MRCCVQPRSFVFTRPLLRGPQPDDAAAVTAALGCLTLPSDLDVDCSYDELSGTYHNFRLNASNVWCTKVQPHLVAEAAATFERLSRRPLGEPTVGPELDGILTRMLRRNGGPILNSRTTAAWSGRASPQTQAPRMERQVADCYRQRAGHGLSCDRSSLVAETH